MLRCFMVSVAVLTSITALAQGERKISLQEVVKAALESNLDLQLERLNVNTSNIDIDFTKTKYEPLVKGSVSSRESKSEASDGTQGDAGASVTSTGSAWDASFGKKEWFGMDWELSSSNFLSDSNSRFSLGESYGADLSLRFQQKLLKGFSLDKEILLYDEYIARSNFGGVMADLESRIAAVLQGAENGYWDLVLALEQLEVNKRSLELANALYQQNKTKVDVGTLPPIDLINTQAQIASREREIVTAENSVKAAEDALKKIMNLPIDQWSQTLIPTDRMKLDEVQADFQKDVAVAFSKRSEMKKNQESMRRALLDQKQRKNEMRPDLTFGGSYNHNGLSVPVTMTTDAIDPRTGKPIYVNPVTNQVLENFDPTTAEPGSYAIKQNVIGLESSRYSDALEDVFKSSFPGWTASLGVTWSPFNKAGKMNLARANVAIRREELAVEQTKLQIMEDVRSAVRELDATKKSIQASEKAVELSRENLKAEEQKFKNGLSTNYFVAEKQNELVAQETSLIQTKIAYVKAIIAYQKALGILLEERHITVQ